ncbi:uncharacterized protein TrAFT101_009210 [Trichoderma asperellum]|uniref:uncharacterized protein n=1 Tax=Trichoderma asperellum TaxID=101201 RepID=UPI0033200519|nr:hypothetical protein TrAFT101_009210 [Trichoderma asperellum]
MSLPIAVTVATAAIAGIAVVVAIAATVAVVAATAVAVVVARIFSKSASSGTFDSIVLARRILAGYRPLCSHTPGYMYSVTTPQATKAAQERGTRQQLQGGSKKQGLVA